jgi:hypothetical protein
MPRINSAPFALLFLMSLCLCLPLPAQDDRAAGLFTEARQLPLVAQSLSVDIAGGETTIKLIQVFANDGDDIGQADYRLHLPEEASVISFGFWQDERFLAAELKEKKAAQSAHRKAASEGRATGLLEQEGTIHSFSVYPVRAGELKQVETTVRIPVATEQGRSHLRLPIDSFLGQATISGSVLISIETDEPLRAYGIDSTSFHKLAGSSHSVTLALATSLPFEVWWSEETPPLLTRAEAVQLDDSRLGLQVRVVLNDAAVWSTPYSQLNLLLDGSFSMHRRSQSLVELVERVRMQATTPVWIYGISDQKLEIPSHLSAQEVVQALLDGATFSTSWDLMRLTMEELGCSEPTVRCLAVTDPQVLDLADDRDHEQTLFISDAHELSYFDEILGEHALVYQTGAEPVARLHAIADQMVRPSLEVRSLIQDGRPLELPGSQSLQVAEGGMLRLYAFTETTTPIELMAEIEGRQELRLIQPEQVEPDSRNGRSIRRGLFHKQLAGMMRDYARSKDSALKQRIIELSLREKIPTALTSLQVDDPELSLTAIKPGDPVLTVYGEPDLLRVTAWYPFGALRDLSYDAETDTFSDRFLVPRGWRETFYRIEIFKTYSDGSVARDHVWYWLDEQAPDAIISLDITTGVIRIDTGEGTPEISSVTIHTPDGRVLTLSPFGNQWLLPIADAGERFTIFVRDRAGNRSSFGCAVSNGLLTVTNPSPKEAPAASSSTLPRNLQATASGGLTIDGDRLHLEWQGADLGFARAGARLGSLQVSALLAGEPGQLLIGSKRGDLISLDCREGIDDCRAQSLTRSLVNHPVTGLARLGPDSVLIGVLGKGLYELAGGGVEASPYRVGSRYITGVIENGNEVLIATAYNGLWRIVDGRIIKTRFAADHVSGLVATAEGIEIISGCERYLHRGRDRFEALGATPPITDRAADLTSGLLLDDGRLLVGGFDRGLLQWDGKDLVEVELGLTVSERRINDLLTFAGSLWLATNGGLLRIDGSAVTRVSDVMINDLAVTGIGLAVATKNGLYLVEESGTTLRLDDLQRGAPRAYFSVAWWQDAIYAGTMEGLFRFRSALCEPVSAAEGLDAGWINALLADGEHLLVGTYYQGVFSYDGIAVTPIAGLEHQWVPLHAMRRVGDQVWIGGIGMPPVRLDVSGRVEPMPVPAHDVNDFVSGEDGSSLYLLTSAGLMTLAR